MRAFAAAFGLTFVTEFGDKTQLAILTLAARYSWFPVFIGALLAFVALNAAAVTVGVVLARLVPETVIRYVSAGAFIVFGLLTFVIRDEPVGADEPVDGDEPVGAKERKAGGETARSERGPFLASLALVALMELGDKTQLSLLALTSRYDAPFWIFLGGTLALALTSLIGALAGGALSAVVPLRYIRWASGVVFIIFGILAALDVL